MAELMMSPGRNLVNRSGGSPVKDLTISIYLLPVFWLLGLEQFIWPIVAFWLLVKSVVETGASIKSDPIYTPVLIFLVFVLISLLMIDEPYRYLTYIRNSSMLFASIIISFVIFQSCKTKSQLYKLLAALVFFQLCLSVTGVFAVLGLSFEYKAPISIFSGSNSGYLEDIFNKNLIQAEALWFSEGFYRPKGLMLYANILAGATVSLAAIKYYLLQQRYFSAAWSKILYLSFFTDAVVFFSTLSRSAWLGLSVSILLLFFNGNMTLRKKLIFLMSFSFVIVLCFAFGVDELVYSRAVEKGHSNSERLLNYQLIWHALSDSPVRFLFGYGTQRDVAELNIPLGSHSTYLGYLYKYGVLGLLSFIGFLLLLFFRVRRYLLDSARNVSQNEKLFARCVGVSLSVIFVQAAFIEVDVDALYQLIAWVLVGVTLVVLPAKGRSILWEGSSLRGNRTETPVHSALIEEHRISNENKVINGTLQEDLDIEDFLNEDVSKALKEDIDIDAFLKEDVNEEPKEDVDIDTVLKNSFSGV